MAKKISTYQLAVQLYSFRDYCDTARKAASTLKKLRKQGWRKVQISGGIDRLDPLDVKKMADDAGVDIIGHHTNLGTLRDAAERANLIDKLHVWDCSYTAVASIGGDERKTGAMWRARAREMNKYGKMLAKEGITLQYHNHAFEFEKFGAKRGAGGQTGLGILYANTDPKIVQAEIDTAWVARGGGDPAAWVLSMKDRMDQVHLKDTVIQNNEHIFTAIGEGNLNWDAVIKACKKIRVKDYIVEQDTCPLTNGNPFKSYEISYKNLKKMGLK